MRTQQPRGGRIINNGSLAAHTPRPQAIAYTTTKHAITGLTKATALDGRAYDIEFVDADDEPYATIAALKPDIVVVSLDLDGMASFQLLTMLRLDPLTASIPVLSYVRDAEVNALGPASVDPNPARLAGVSVAGAQRH